MATHPRLRKLWIALAALVLVLAALVAGIYFLVDAERYRPAIEARATAALGRAVRVGKIRLSLFPFGLRADDLAVEKLPAEGQGDLLTVDSVHVQARLAALLGKRLEVTGIAIEGPRMVLERGRDGAWNVERLFAPQSVAEAAQADVSARPPAAERGPTTSVTAQPPAQAAPEGAAVVIESMTIHGGRVTVRDAARARPIEWVVSDLEARLADVAADRAIGIDVHASFGGGGRLGIEGRVGPLPADGAALPLDVTLRLDGITGPALAHLTELIGIGAEVREASLELDLAGNVPDRFDARGTLDLLGTTIRTTAADGTRGESALDAGLSFDAGVREGGALLELREVEVAAWNSAVKLAGTVGLGGQTPVVDLHVGPASLTAADLAALVALLIGESPVAFDARSPIELDLVARGALPAEPPAVASPPLRIDGSVRVAEGSFDTLDFRDLTATFGWAARGLSLDPVTATLYDGTFAGAVLADLTGQVPSFVVRGEAHGVELGAFLADNLGEGNLLSGRFTGRIDTRAEGVDSATILRTLAGTGSVEMVRGHVGGLDVLERLSQVSGLLGETTVEQLTGRLAAEGTGFDRLTGDARIAGGEMRLDRLALEAPDFRIDGGCDVDLGQATLDGQFRLTLSQSVSESMRAEDSLAGKLFWNAKSKRVELPFGLAGPFTEPAVSVDLKSVARDAARTKLESGVRKLLAERLGAAPEGEAPSPPASTPAGSGDPALELTLVEWRGAALAPDLKIEGVVRVDSLASATLVVVDARGREVHSERIAAVDERLAAAEPRGRVKFRSSVDGKRLLLSRMPLTVRLVATRTDGTTGESARRVER